MATPNPNNVTFFTTCKPFTGEAAILQRNALLTWQKLGLKVIICGPEDGAAEAATEFGTKHVPNIETNDKGTPLIRSIFYEAEKACDTPFLAYINADILLTTHAVSAIFTFLKERADEPRFLLTMRRRNIPLGHALKTEGPVWQEELMTLDQNFGSWDQSNAIDLFLYNRGLFDEIIPLVIGHMQWDNWLLWKAKNRGADIIDASLDGALLHPIHGYGGDGTGLQHRSQGSQAARNRALAAGNSADLQTATTHLLTGGKLVERNTAAKERLETMCQPDLAKEFWAGIKYLSASNEWRTTGEALDCCRTILWRHARFFPFFEDTTISQEELQKAVSTAQKYEFAGNLVMAGDTIQDLAAKDFLERIIAEEKNGREIHIWGCGGAGKRVLDLLIRHGIGVSAFRDSDPAKAGQLIGGITVISSKTPTRDQPQPFLVIASMHASEIASDFEAKGLKKYQDFTG